jgi:hypothetical protein
MPSGDGCWYGERITDGETEPAVCQQAGEAAQR